MVLSTPAHNPLRGSAGLLRERHFMDQPATPTGKTPRSPEKEVLARFAQDTAALTARLTLGLASKRKAESWEDFEERVIQMFRDKGLFKNEEKQA
jgi:hypothetical protein